MLAWRSNFVAQIEMSTTELLIHLSEGLSNFELGTRLLLDLLDIDTRCQLGESQEAFVAVDLEDTLLHSLAMMAIRQMKEYYSLGL